MRICSKNLMKCAKTIIEYNQHKLHKKIKFFISCWYTLHYANTIFRIIIGLVMYVKEKYVDELTFDILKWLFSIPIFSSIWNLNKTIIQLNTTNLNFSINKRCSSRLFTLDISYKLLFIDTAKLLCFKGYITITANPRYSMKCTDKLAYL